MALVVVQDGCPSATVQERLLCFLLLLCFPNPLHTHPLHDGLGLFEIQILVAQQKSERYERQEGTDENDHGKGQI